MLPFALSFKTLNVRKNLVALLGKLRDSGESQILGTGETNFPYYTHVAPDDISQLLTQHQSKKNVPSPLNINHLSSWDW